MGIAEDLAAEVAGLDDTPSEVEAKRLGDKCREFYEAAERVEKLEAALEAAKVLRNQIAQRDLPDLMIELKTDRYGLPEFGETGVDLVLSDYFHASIPKETEAQAHDWLEQQGHGSIIRTTVSHVFGKDQLPVARALQALISALSSVVGLVSTDEDGVEDGRYGVSPEQLDLLLELTDPLPSEVKRGVPWATLTAWLREQYDARREMTAEERLAAGEIPLELLGATVGKVVKIKPRKK